MAINRIRVVTNCDEATVVWESDRPIPGCRGFALEREVDGEGQSSILDTWVGFKGQKHKPGEHRPSTEWPIQRYIWSDYFAPLGKRVRYRAIPMTGSAGALLKAPQSEWSAWTPWRTIGTGQTAGLEAYFNRGIVPAQWIARQHPSKKSLQSDIDNPKSKNRAVLSGALRTALLDVLATAASSAVEIYAALYELDDPELIAALKKIGDHCHLILGSGAYKAANKKKQQKAVPDENAAVRKDLKQHSNVDVHDRLVKSPHFAHNKFVVLCDGQGNPNALWTGSTNWTDTGLCTQVNNGILIHSPQLAAICRKRWDDLKNAGAGYPAGLSTSPATHGTASIGPASITAWNAPVTGLVDLADAEERIRGAQNGILFLMFNPGPKNTLLNTILDLKDKDLFIHGVVNQDPGGKKAPLLTPTHKGQTLPAQALSAILPAGVTSGRNWFDKSFTFNRVMIHSKVVVLDPFGKKPVVMTGSHNLGPKASEKNDDNLVIIENAPGLAGEYAVNILGVYGHYKWLYNEALKKPAATRKAIKATPQYDGNFDDDQWQQWYTAGANRREMDFWLQGV